MSNATDYLEGQIGNHLLRTASWSKPANVYVGLFTTMPADDGTGGVEVSGGSYTRVGAGPGDAYWNGPSAGNGEFSNAAIITFATPTGSWGSVQGFGLFDASSSGTLLLAGTLTTARSIASGDPAPNFPVGALKITVS